jgi:DNA-binding NarL/FixJ family response regulator
MIRVMLVDDHAVVREGYRRLLELQGDMQVVAEAADGQEALQRWRDTPMDVMVVDLALPGLGGLELMARLRQRGAGCGLLAFSMHRDPVWAVQALRAGALGYVTKSSPPRAPGSGRAVSERGPAHDQPRHRRRRRGGPLGRTRRARVTRLVTARI